VSANFTRRVLLPFLLGTILAVFVNQTKADWMNPFELMKTAKFPYIGGYHVAYRDTFDKWLGNYRMLGLPRTDELYVKTEWSDLDTAGTAMGCKNGTIYRIGTGPLNGKSYIVAGKILKKYYELGGVHSRLGFPTSQASWYNSDFEGGAQFFQGGVITWDPPTKTYVVRYTRP